MRAVVSSGELRCSLEEAALVLARQEYPDLEPAPYLARIDAIAELARPMLSEAADAPEVLGVVNDVLFRDLGFRGNTEEYYDARNSFLNEVLERRTGIPITLAVFGAKAEQSRARGLSLAGTYTLGMAALFSTLGRTAARGLETVLIARRLNVWYDQLVQRIRNGDTATFTRDKWEPEKWPKQCQGYGRLDAPRGALGHWVQIADGKITRYQCVVPSTWNCSPRDKEGQLGPYEASLTDNHPLVRPEQPLEILRTIHSFDPCMSCGVHVLDATGGLVTEVRVQ